MARKRSSSPDPAAELRPGPFEPEESVEEFLAGIGDDANRVVIYRYDSTTSRQEYCGSLPWPGVDIPEEIRKRWGGGRFSIRLYGPPTKERQSGYIGIKPLSISGPTRDLARAAELESDPDRDRRRADEAEARARELEALRREDRIVAGLAELKDFMADLRHPPAGALDASPFSMALELVKEMQSRLVPHVTTPLPDGSQFLDMFKLGLEIGRESAGGGGPYDNVVEKVGIPLIRLLENRMGAQALPAGESAAAVPNPPPAGDLRGALAEVVPYLLEWAQAGRDAGVRADVVAEEIPEAWHDQLADIVLDGSATTRMLGWFPELGPHRAWVEQFVQGLRENLEEPETDQGDADATAAGGVELGTGTPPL